MGWIISQPLYEKWHCSQELEEESSEDICLDGKQFAPLSGNPTQLAYLSPDKMTKFSRLSRFGMTFKPLTESRGEDLLMWYREDFLAKTYPVQEEAQELTESDPACGAKWHELSEKYDLDSCSWRTHQCLWDEELHWSSVTLPRWGMIANGVLFQHPTAERPISETGSGYWLTPTTMNIAPTESRREKRTEYRASVGRKDSPGSLAEQVMTPKFWPTPRSCSAMAAMITPENSWDQDRFPNLETIVGRNMWPTPSAHKNTKSGELINKDGTLWDGMSKPHSKKTGKQVQTALADAVTKWPTPTAHNAKETNAPSEANRNEPTLASRVGGHLNPMWVEWLMGWPLGWTDLKPLAMDRFQSWQQQHSVYCEADE
jgi:hypothetical protein